MLEADYQAKLVRKIRRLFPGCVVLKNDSEYQPGFPDLTILWHHMWAVLEVKAEEGAAEQPNQRWFVEHLDQWSFAAFIYPENETEVLHALQFAFASAGGSRLPKRE